MLRLSIPLRRAFSRGTLPVPVAAAVGIMLLAERTRMALADLLTPIRGLLQGTQGHLDFLPEKRTDVIVSMLAEEFGLAGALSVLALLSPVILFCVPVAFRSRHRFGRLLATGLGTNLFLYVFVNIAVVTGSIPVGGVPLPLISHGGSAMPTTMLGFGPLLSLHVHRDAEFGAAGD